MGAYLVGSLLLFLGHAAGLIGLRGLLASVALITIVNVALLAAFKLKFNERFADPALTLAQTLAAITVIMFVAYHFERDRSLVLAWCLVVMLFGVFRFKPRDFGTTTLYMLAGYALVINLLMSLKPDKVDVLIEWYQWAWLALLLPPFAWIGARIGVMRARIMRANTELVNALGTIQDMATHDSLTGLHNRASMTDALEHAVSKARRGGESLAIFFIDLDGFKSVNDTLGHATGDQLLREIAQRLRARVRQSDLVARLGGDEFVIMVETVSDRQGLQLLASKILAAAGEPMRLQGHEVAVTASIGIAVFPDDGSDVSTLLANADMAMYRAKALGRNRATEYSADLGESVVERFEIEKGLREGLRNNEFHLYYQPKIEFSSGKLLGVEALIRWHHPTLGVLGPDRFIHVAESSNFIISLGQWVIEQACRQASAWQRAGLPHFSIAVNLSTNQLTDPSLAEHVAGALRASGVDPSMLEFEITETAVMKNMVEATALLESLRALGVRLAIDDFGTGYSSLAYLKRFPIDELKIDRSFVRDIPDDPDDMQIASAIIGMARGLNLRVLAEGVETAAQRDFLLAQGCHAYQGFLCSRPVPAAQFAELASRQQAAHRQAFSAAHP